MLPRCARCSPSFRDMIEWHQKGTRYGIAVDHADGLLKAGVAGVQLTWMDAKVGDWVVTPRIGKPVEINALWYNALRVMSAFATILARAGSLQRSGGRRQTKLCALRPRRRRRFIRRDRRARTATMPAFRPNQIFAVSLPHSPLAAADQAQCRADVPAPPSHRLWAALARAGRPGHTIRIMAAASWNATAATTRGRSGPWLLGPFCLAAYRVGGDARAAQDAAGGDKRRA